MTKLQKNFALIFSKHFLIVIRKNKTLVLNNLIAIAVGYML